MAHSQRERLFAGMARLVARQGYAATTVDQVAAESGVSRKALYVHFSGKEDLLLQAHRAVIGRIAAGAGATVAEQGDWRSALRALLDWCIELFSREPALAHLSLVEVAAATPASRRLQRETFEELRRLLELGADESAKAIPAVAIDGMLGGIVYVVASAAEEGDSAQLAALRPRLMAWIALLLDGPSEAAAELAQGGD